MKKLLIMALYLSINTGSMLFAYQWPSEDTQVLESFGQKSPLSESVQRGLRLITNESHITPIDQGEILFAQNTKSVLPSRSSGTVVMAHVDSLYTIYTDIDDTTYDGQQINFQLDEGKNERIYQLYVYDSQVKQYVNPALFLPLGRLGKRIFIDRLVAIDTTGKEYGIFNGAILPNEEVSLYVMSYSIDDYGHRLNPKEFTLQILGNNLAKMNFSAMMEEGGNAYLSGDEPVLLDSLYNERGMLYLAKTSLMEGQLSMVMKVIDLDGQIQENTMRIRVVNLN